MTDHNASVATNQLRRDIAAALDQDTVDADAYLDGAYLEAAFSAGFEVADLARAHDVSKNTTSSTKRLQRTVPLVDCGTPIPTPYRGMTDGGDRHSQRRRRR
jgi:hypothetical protein